MKKFLTFVILLLILSFSAFAQTTKDNLNNQDQTNQWIRVQSDNGEFSIEVPEKFNYFFDKDGFLGSTGPGNFTLKNMSLLNSYFDQTLLSFEIYETPKAAIEMFMRHDKRLGYSPESENKQNKTMIKKADKFYSVKNYYNSKKFVYVLTAASKAGQTPALKRFFDSLVFKPDTKETPNLSIPSLSKLRVTPIDVNSVKSDQSQSVNKDDTTKKDDYPGKMIIVHKTIPVYVDAARRNEIQGTVKLRVEFSSDGFIPKIEILKSLPGGLLRQVIFSAIRLKFIPEERNGKPITVTEPLEYSFVIY